MSQVSSLHKISNRSFNAVFIGGVFAGILFAFLFIFNQAFASPPLPKTTTSPAWLEPRGINASDMVGLVPEEHLQDAIVAYQFGHGLIQYISGSREDGQVVMRVRYHMTLKNELFCPAKAPFEDEFPSAMLPSTIRIFEDGNDVTAEVNSSLRYIPAGFQLPTSHNLWRYASTTIQTTFDDEGALELPANMDCTISFNRPLTGDVTAEFKINSGPPMINIETIHQTVYPAKTAIFTNYAGGGENVLSLNTQMVEKYQDQMAPFGRHEGWAWWEAEDSVRTQLVNEANYVFIKPPPSPIDMYGSVNEPGSGMMRLMRSDGVSFHISVAHLNSMMVPFHLSWDYAFAGPNAVYRDTFTAFEFRGPYQEFDEIKPPEHFLPPGVPYDTCMTNGGCSDALLAQVWETEYPMDIYFYKVTRIRGGLQQIPLKSVGIAWTPGDAFSETDNTSPMSVEADNMLLTPTNFGGGYAIYLPTLVKSLPPDPVDPTIVCPCGWFDEYGRMLDVIEGDVP